MTPRNVDCAKRTLRFGLLLGVIGLVALAIRVAFVLIVDPDVPSIGDATAYHLLGTNLADGLGYIRPFDLLLLGESRPTAEYPPLHPLLLSIFSSLGASGVVAQRLLLSAVGAVGVVVVGLLGRRVAGDLVGLVAAGVAATYPMLFLSEAILMAETLYALLVTTAILLAYRAAEMPTPRSFAILGVVIGIAALARAEALLLVPLIAVPLALTRPSGRRQVLAAVTVLATMATIAPWTVRNAATFGAFVPVSNNVGTALDGANCDQTYAGAQKGLWLFPDCFEGFDLTEIDEAEAAAFHRDEGLHYVRRHLGAVPGVVAVRLLRTWGLYSPADQIRFESLEGRPIRWQTLGTRMYWAMLPLAVAGAMLLRRRRRLVWPLLMTGVMVTFTAAATYGQQRFRVAAEPAILVLAAVAIVAIATRLASVLRADV